MKKIISAILTVALVVSATAATAFAKAEWKNGNGKFIPPGIAKKLFDDSDEIKWAQKAIEKLKSKGLISGWEGKYWPNRSVTKIEAVVMALRIMDWEDEALSKTSLPKQYKGSQVQQWAVGYVAAAYEQGILDDVDMMHFNPQEPAKRHEVAKYVIRALGKEDEAQDHMNAKLSFADASAVPQGSVGYVYLVNDLGIMKGDGKTFNPMGTLTRAEMAVLFNNLDEKVDGENDVDEYYGSVTSIEDEKIVLKIGASSKTFNVSDDAVVYDGRTRAEYSDIDVGDKVNVQLEDDLVVYIEIVEDEDTGSKIIYRYTGDLTAKYEGNPSTITVKMDGMTATFKVINGAGVYFKGVKGDFDELVVGDDVTVTVDNNNWARRISVDRQQSDNVVSEVEGTLESINSSSVRILVGTSVREYRYAEVFTIDVEGHADSLSNIVKGMEIEIKLENSLVTFIHAKDHKFELDAEIDDITLSNGIYRLKLEVGNKMYTYEVSKDAEIIIDDDDAEADDLEEGMEGEFEIVNNTIVKVDVED